MEKTFRILGIDPGLRRTGWGFIDVTGSILRYVACGIIRPNPDAGMAERLTAIHDGLNDILHEYHPQLAAVEETFVNKDPKSTLKLGQARGVAMLVPGLHQIPVAEYAPNVVKKSIVGAGHADKKQIRLMVNILLPKAQFTTDDEADALAIAICHAHHYRSYEASTLVGA